MKLIDSPSQGTDLSKNHPIRRQIDETQRELNHEDWMLSKPFLKRDNQRKIKLEATLEQLRAELPENRLDRVRVAARRPIRKLPDSLPSSGKKVA